MIARIHIEKEEEDETSSRMKPKKKRILPIGKEDENAEKGSEPIKMKTYSSVLRSASPHFESLLASNMRESTEMVMDIYAESVVDVENMIFFLYTNRLMKSDRAQGRALPLIRLAHLFELKALFDCCREQILEKVNINNFVESVKVFNRYEIDDGLDRLISYGKRRLNRLKKLDSYEQLPFIFRRQVLEKEDDDSEDDSSSESESYSSSYASD